MGEQHHHGVATRDAIDRLSGLEQLREMIAGRLPSPPMAGWLRFALVDVREGWALFEGQPDASFLNQMGIVHGGWALTLIDSAAGCAGLTLLDPGAGYTTVDTHANFSRPIMPDVGLVRAEGTVVSSGRRIITTDARITDASGRLLAHGGSTLLIF